MPVKKCQTCPYSAVCMSDGFMDVFVGFFKGPFRDAVCASYRRGELQFDDGRVSRIASFTVDHVGEKFPDGCPGRPFSVDTEITEVEITRQRFCIRLELVSGVPPYRTVEVSLV